MFSGQFAILLNREEGDNNSIVMEIWHKDKKITAYIEKDKIGTILLVENDVIDSEIDEGVNLYDSLQWLIEDTQC